MSLVYFHSSTWCLVAMWKFPEKKIVSRIKIELKVEFAGWFICFNIYKKKLIKLPATTCSAASKSHYDLSAERREFYWQLFVWQSRECISMYNRTMLALDTKWTGHYFWKQQKKWENWNEILWLFARSFAKKSFLDIFKDFSTSFYSSDAGVCIYSLYLAWRFFKITLPSFTI